jgi:hypothetical protein
VKRYSQEFPVQFPSMRCYEKRSANGKAQP